MADNFEVMNERSKEGSGAHAGWNVGTHICHDVKLFCTHTDVFSGGIFFYIEITFGSGWMR